MLYTIRYTSLLNPRHSLPPFSYSTVYSPTPVMVAAIPDCEKSVSFGPLECMVEGSNMLSLVVGEDELNELY